MKILLLGSGGREHAFAWKLSQNPLCEKLSIAPGNAGTSQHGENVPIGVNDFDAIEKFVLENKIELVMVGPEDPLVNGIYDYFLSKEELKNIPVIGPSKAGAQLEGSKSFAKQFMVRHNIPTATYGEFTIGNLEDGFVTYCYQQFHQIIFNSWQHNLCFRVTHAAVVFNHQRLSIYIHKTDIDKTFVNDVVFF